MKENCKLDQRLEEFAYFNKKFLKLLKLEIVENDTIVKKLWKLLYLAVRQGNLGIVKLLLEQGVDVNMQDDTYGDTPLHVTARYNQPKIARLLVEKKANINIKNKAGWEAIKIAMFFDEMPFSDILTFQGILLIE